MHGLFETSFFVVVDVDFDGPTVGVVVAERFETAVLADDITGDGGVGVQIFVGI